MTDKLADEVRRYYDESSERFERYGQGRASIHRAVWGPGVETREAAFRYVDELILAELRACAHAGTARVLDLGCGLGATLMHLASRASVTGEGITISPVQAARATRLAAAAGLAGSVRFRAGDFLALPHDLFDVDLALSIEAFIHSPDAARYFGEAARVLRPKGRLIVCDDVLTQRGASARSRREQHWLDEFRRGWHVGSLVTVDDARRLGAACGLTLVRDVDLTPHLELGRPRDRAIALLVGIGRHLPWTSKYWQSLVGGNALQHALGSGLVAYRFLVFERR